MQPPTPAVESEQVPRPPPGPLPTRIANVTTEYRADTPRLHVAAAARRLGVAPSTLRTWDRRYGIGPTDRSPGRHRRYSPDDLARLDLMHRALILGATPAEAAAHALAALPAHPDAARPSPATAGRHPGAGTCMGDVPAAPEAGEQQPAGAGGSERLRVRTGGPALRLPGVARPVLAAVGQRWADSGAGIEIEHLLSDCVTAVFSAVATTAVPARTARPVLLAGMAGDQHRLPLVVLATTLTQRGVSCRSLGADLPSTALATAIRRTAPAAVLLWSQLKSTADPQVLRSLPRTRPEYRRFVAGPGWAEMELPPQVGRLESLVEATDALGAAATG